MAKIYRLNRAAMGVLTAASIVAGILLAACTGPDPDIQPQDDSLTRYFAEVSNPQILPGGEKLLFNGNLLRRYSSTGQLLNQKALPLAAQHEMRGGFRLSAAQEIYAVHGFKSLSRLDPLGELAWTRHYDQIDWHAALPGGGVLVFHRGGGQGKTLLRLDSEGSELWSLADPSIRRVALSGNGNLLLDMIPELRCYDLELNLLWEYEGGPALRQARDGHALLVGERVECLDPEGSLRWILAMDWDGGDYALLDDGAAAMYKLGSTPQFPGDGFGPSSLLIIDGDGSIRLDRQLPADISPHGIAAFDEDSFLFQYYTDYSHDSYNIALCSAHSGLEEWSYRVLRELGVQESEFRESRTFRTAERAADGRIYFEDGSVLYELSPEGLPGPSYEGDSYYDVQAGYN